MKKIIAVILSVIIVLSCAPLTFAADNDLSMIFLTDTHFSKKDSSNPITGSTDADPFGHVVSNGKLVAESDAILNEFFNQAAKSDADYIVITGDISDNGIIENVEAVVKRWEEFEKTSGKTVIACMGNHETYHLSENNSYISGGLTGPEFRELYKNLGYDKALAIDEETASYTVDLNGKYRLVLIDTNAVTERLVNWIGEQAAAAKKDGKYLISASHMPLFPHNKVMNLVNSGGIDKSFGLPDKYIDWGIKFNFSGHTHELDTAQYTNKKGIVYDITNGALTTYPANFKTAKFTDKGITIGTEYIEKIDMSLVPDGLSREAYDLIESNFREYAHKMFIVGAQKEIGHYVNPNYLVNMAKLDRTKDAEIVTLLETVVTRFNEALKMPLYGENSLSSIAKGYGHNLAKSEYATIFEAACTAYCNHCTGNEDCSVYTPLGKLSQKGLSTALAYALDGLSEEDFKTVINWALDTFDIPVEISPKLRNLASRVLSKYEEVEYIALYIISPFLDDFLDDPLPDDVTANFPAYSKNEVKSAVFKTGFDTVIRYIRLIFNALISIIVR